MIPSHHFRSDSRRAEAFYSASGHDGTGDTPSNYQLLCAPLQRPAACASTHPAPSRLSPGRVVSEWLRPIPGLAPVSHIGPWRLYGGTPYSDNSRAPDGHWETAT